MSYLGIGNLNALGDKTKLVFTSVDPDLESSVQLEVFAQLEQVYNVTTWTDNSNTPALAIRILAMFYVGWYYERTYSEDGSSNSYGLLLIARGQRLIDGVLSGAIVFADAPSPAMNDSAPTFYPNDGSTAQLPNYNATNPDTSLGPNVFSVGMIF